MQNNLIFKIKDLPASERPRERLIKQGAAALSEAELLAVILRTGNRHENVVNLTKRMLRSFDLKELSEASLVQLKKYSGINNAKACQLVACFELGRRLSSYTPNERICIECSADVVKLISSELKLKKREHFVGLYLDSRNCLLKKNIVSIGGLNTSLVHPREIFRVAIQESANAVIIAHNHPSGNPQPSRDDILITKKIVHAGKYIGIPLLDHVVIAEDGYVSMAERGLVKF